MPRPFLNSRKSKLTYLQALLVIRDNEDLSILETDDLSCPVTVSLVAALWDIPVDQVRSQLIALIK